jgi:hypothetical protein
MKTLTQEQITNTLIAAMKSKEWSNIASSYGDAANIEIMKYLNSTNYL